MGILDDAIREHLELKRQHGAQSDDIERLEKEAFGPLTRPGDPDFADSGETDAQADEVSFGPGGEAPGVAAEGSPAGAGDWFDADEEETRVLSAEPEQVDRAREEPSALDETAEHTAPASEEGGTSAPTAEPPEAPERGIFDAEEIDFGELDLDEAEGRPAGAPSGSRLAPAPADLGDLGDDLELGLSDDPPATEQPIVTEDRRANLTEDDEDAPPAPVAPRGGPEVAGQASPSSEEGGEDLLEETPDFLQDAPEGERLWFEQGEPKDFDFDED